MQIFTIKYGVIHIENLSGTVIESACVTQANLAEELHIALRQLSDFIYTQGWNPPGILEHMHRSNIALAKTETL